MDILIGTDYIELYCTLEEIKGDHGDPIARRTSLGWTCIGRIKSKESRVYQSNFVRTYNASAVDLHEINTTLKKFWQIDDVSCKNKGVFTKEEVAASAAVSKSLEFKDGRYELAIPWKDDSSLPNNYIAAFKRLENIEKRLLKQPELGAKYCGIIEDHINKGYLEYVDPKQGTDNGWLLPHFPIIRPDKSTIKVRLVYDGSAKCEGKSLNDVIHPGP